MIKKLVHKFINRETIAYVIVGLTTTLVNLGLYTILCLCAPYTIANLLALISAKLYAYFMNKFVVFKTGFLSLKQTVLEFTKFFIARCLTFLIDYFGLILLVSVLHFDKLISKYALQIAVISINYFLGKFFVFVKKNQDDM